MEQASLPTFEWPALVPGPVFFSMEVEGKPGHKGRHRSRLVIPKDAWTYAPGLGSVITRGGAKRIWISQYPDPATEQYEAMLKEYAELLMRRKAPTERPLALLVHSFRAVPQSWPRADRERALAGNIRPTPRPDWDNHGKITDALNGIVWKDDSQVVDGRSLKYYSDRPGLRIEVREFVEPAEIGGADAR